MTGFDLLFITGLLLSLFVALGLSRSWRLGAVSFALFAAYVAYDWVLPTSADPADEVGQEAWRLILLIWMIGCAVVFAASFGAAKLWARRSQNRAKEAVQ